MILCCKVTKNALNECNFLRKMHWASAIFTQKRTERVRFWHINALGESENGIVEI